MLQISLMHVEFDNLNPVLHIKHVLILPVQSWQLVSLQTVLREHTAPKNMGR